MPSNSTEGLARENSVRIAVLVGMKPGLEVFFNIACGFLIDRYSVRLLALEEILIFVAPYLLLATLRHRPHCNTVVESVNKMIYDK